MSISCVINFNIHRAKEGARVLEDVARFVLYDEELFDQIRTLRHALLATPPIISADVDLGGPAYVENNLRNNLLQIVQANSLRIQEALRVLEEVSDTSFNKEKMKSLRYQAYGVQREIYQKTQLFLKHDKLTGLYIIIDPGVIDIPLTKMIDMINVSPVNIVQFRRKQSTKREFIEQANEIRSRLKQDKVFIINDHLDVALDLADGVHLGQDDYPIERVRKLIPSQFIFGVSCHNVDEANHAVRAGASYIGVGCIFKTTSKQDVISTSLYELEKIVAAVNIPVCAIGGINADNINSVLSRGVDMVAMISAPWRM